MLDMKITPAAIGYENQANCHLTPIFRPQNKDLPFTVCCKNIPLTKM